MSIVELSRFDSETGKIRISPAAENGLGQILLSDLVPV
jgi:hypothetical protein